MATPAPATPAPDVNRYQLVDVSTLVNAIEKLSAPKHPPLKHQRLGFVEEIKLTAFYEAIIAEFVSTMFFVMIGVGSAVSTAPMNAPLPVNADGGRTLLIAIAFGLGVTLMASSMGHHSGAHLNPAVTLGVVLTGRISILRAFAYWIAQCGGALCGVGLVRAMVSDSLATASAMGATTPAVPIGNAFVAECIGTLLLVFVVYAVVVDPRNESRVFAGVVIGLTVGLVHTFNINLTGCGINPARSLASAVWGNKWDDHWLYWIAPLCGGAAGGIIHYFLFYKFFKDVRSDESIVQTARRLSGSGTKGASALPKPSAETLKAAQVSTGPNPPPPSQATLSVAVSTPVASATVATSV